MAMNLRLPPDLAEALRQLAEQTGRSQQEIARDALAEYVRDYPLRDFPKNVRGSLRPPLRPYRRITPQAVPGVEPGALSAEMARTRADR